MLLTIDTGNTNIAIGLMDGDRIVDSFRLMTKTPRTSDEFMTFLYSFLETAGVRPEEIEDIVLSSVVPKLNYTLSAAVYKTFGRKPLIIDHETETGITVAIDNPREVGADLLVDMAAAYSRVQDSCLVLDFGTATTLTYVSKDAFFRYAVICPGLGISANVLTDNTAKLPEIEIRVPESSLASNTVDAMQVGVVIGYIGMIETIIRRMKEELHDPDCRVIATGGLGRVVSSATDLIDEYDPDLAYHGMRVIYDLMKKAGRV
ncbi:MAG: type III pantothenate kinase [Solobacterium sp.]|nr:type III pantothenate kinase [Solobacterium sp.]MBQ1321115.1 type III pantothenate kinase [Solobacterium sp.]MBQ1354978.1 type III pantothenate kinase [Solobacterium sp.]